jgi:flavin-dependent thymidylate synthase
MSELEFTKKPRRLQGFKQYSATAYSFHERVKVELELDPMRIMYFTREATWGDVFTKPSKEEMLETLQEIIDGKALGAAKEVPALAFKVRASRVCMDQLLRHTYTKAGAQTSRDIDMRAFNVILPDSFAKLGKIDPTTGAALETDTALRARCTDLLDQMRQLYGDLVDAGMAPQDARYVALPMGYETQWVQIMNLRALEDICAHRLCNGLAQHETNYVVRLMRDEVVRKFPWADDMLRSRCEKTGRCTQGGLLFPPCGAFGGVSSEFDPEEHLYPAEANEAMRYAEWDKARQISEDELPQYAIPFVVDQHLSRALVRRPVPRSTS